MKHLVYVIIAAALTVAAGCSKKDYFKVKGEISGLGSRTVTMLYYSSGGLQRVSAHADGNGAFELNGQSAAPTLAVVELPDGTVLANIVADNGDEIKLEGDLEKPLEIKVKGNGTSSSIADWQRENAQILMQGDADAINKAVARYVGGHKGNLASTVILVTHFRSAGHELLADSLMTLIDPDVRPGGVVQNFSAVLASQLSHKANDPVKPMILSGLRDSSFYFTPSAHSLSLLAFMPSSRSCSDSVMPRLSALREAYPVRTVEIVEFATTLDSARWASSVARDSVKWHRTWAPAGLSAPAIRALAVPRVPYFIVVDSVGRQLLRTHSISVASSLVGRSIRQ